MNHWYLVASLPYLRFGEKSPMNRMAFLTACTSWLSEAEVAVIQAALENRDPVDGGVAQLWWNGEIQLRDAVVRVRAKKYGIDAAPFIQLHDGFSVSIEEMVTDAFTHANPLEQEAELDRARWTLAEELTRSNPFSFAGILAFAIKLRIVERWAGMDDEAGKEKVEEWIGAPRTKDRIEGVVSE